MSADIPSMRAAPNEVEPAPKAPGVALAIAAGWAVFFWSWVRVLQRTSISTLAWGVLVLVVITAVVVSITVWWITHNLRIYRRKGPRRSVPVAMPEYRTDFVGRDLHGDWMMLRRSSVVLVGVDEEGKHFLPGVESGAWGVRR